MELLCSLHCVWCTTVHDCRLCSKFAWFAQALHALLTFGMLQLELSRNKCRDKRIDVWPRAVDTTIFNPAFRCEAMRRRMTDGHTDTTVLVYVGRLGAGLTTLHSCLIPFSIALVCLQPALLYVFVICCVWPFQPSTHQSWCLEYPNRHVLHSARYMCCNLHLVACMHGKTREVTWQVRLSGVKPGCITVCDPAHLLPALHCFALHCTADCASAMVSEKNLEVLRDFLPRLPLNTRLCFVGAGPHMAHLQRHFQGCPVTFMVCCSACLTGAPPLGT